MSQYYLHDGEMQLGPFTIEELKTKEINKDTPVWKDGMQDWVKADNLPELAALLKSPPPAYKSGPPPVTRTELPVYPSRKKNYTIPLLLLLIVLGFGGYYLWESNKSSSGKAYDNNSIEYNPGNNINDNEKSPEELKEDLAQKEQENPGEYLVIKNATFRRNLIGEIVIEGKIKNTATVAGFKDIVIEASFLAPSGTVLDRKEFTRYEKLGPGYEVGFKFKANPNKEVNSVNARIVTAPPIN